MTEPDTRLGDSSCFGNIIFSAWYTSCTWKDPMSTAVGKPKNGSKLKTQLVLLGKSCRHSLHDGHSEPGQLCYIQCSRIGDDVVGYKVGKYSDRFSRNRLVPVIALRPGKILLVYPPLLESRGMGPG